MRVSKCAAPPACLRACVWMSASSPPAGSEAACNKTSAASCHSRPLRSAARARLSLLQSSDCVCDRFSVCLCCCFDSYLEPRASPSVSSPPHRMTLGESGQNLGDSQVSQLIVRFYIRSHPIFLTSLKAAARREIF